MILNHLLLFLATVELGCSSKEPQGIGVKTGFELFLKAGFPKINFVSKTFTEITFYSDPFCTIKHFSFEHLSDI